MINLNKQQKQIILECMYHIEDGENGFRTIPIGEKMESGVFQEQFDMFVENVADIYKQLGE